MSKLWIGFCRPMNEWADANFVFGIQKDKSEGLSHDRTSCLPSYRIANLILQNDVAIFVLKRELPLVVCTGTVEIVF